MRFLNGTSSGDVVTFRCEDGFDLLGFRQLVCGEDNQWNGQWPHCIDGKHDVLSALCKGLLCYQM